MKKHLLIILTMLFCSPSFCLDKQVNFDENYTGAWWLSLGLGAGTASGINSTEGASDSGPAIQIDANYMIRSNQLLTARVYSLDDIFEGSVDEYGLMYGYINKSQEGYVSASAGIAYVHVDYETFLGPSREVNTVGIPLEIDGVLTPFRYFGIGLKGVADLNNEASTYGILLAIQFGDFKV